MKRTPAATIDWGEVRATLEANERALARAVNPDASAVGAVRRRRMVALAGRGARTQSDDRRVSMLVCTLCGERYGIDLAELSHVGRLANVTAISSDAPGVLGVFAWRGEVRTLVCARAVLGLEPAPAARIGDYIVVPHRLHDEVALRVDGVEQIVSIAETSLAAPGEGQVHTNRFVRGRTADGIAVVDMASLLRASLFSGAGEAAPALPQSAGAVGAGPAAVHAGGRTNEPGSLT